MRKPCGFDHRHAALGLLALALTACGATQPAAQETTVSTTPEFVPTAAVDNNITRLNSDLTDLKSTVQHLQQEAEKAASAPGPSFDGEPDTLKSKAIEDCDTAETVANNLLNEEYVKNTSSVSSNVNDDLAEIRALRERIRQIK